MGDLHGGSGGFVVQHIDEGRKPRLSGGKYSGVHLPRVVFSSNLEGHQLLTWKKRMARQRGGIVVVSKG